jgi:hypothetical protein
MEYRYDITQFHWNPKENILYAEAGFLFFQMPDGSIHPEAFPNQRKQFWIHNPKTGGFRRFRFKNQLRNPLTDTSVDWVFESEDGIVCKIKKSIMNIIDGNTSDGYHTFNELYEFRKVYNAALFNEWGKSGKWDVHKSWKHSDGEPCFGGGWFIVVAILPSGQISNHYEAGDWDLFKIKETERALYSFDGHSGRDVIDRLVRICKGD